MNVRQWGWLAVGVLLGAAIIAGNTYWVTWVNAAPAGLAR